MASLVSLTWMDYRRAFRSFRFAVIARITLGAGITLYLLFFGSVGRGHIASQAVTASGISSTSTSATGSGPEPDGWYAGDMHVHRSCGGTPQDLSKLHSMMSPNRLATISVLADMGNGEVQDPQIDLPLVNGQDASVSTAGQIVHWDAEWHWDTTYSQYPHGALAGHVVALGLKSAEPMWQEYAYPILSWVHQQGGIAGFAHMQYLDGHFPNVLTCCTAIEYPVEIALGTADFLSEDVSDSGTQFNDAGTTVQIPMNPEFAIQAYYKLLNSGFRPGFAAGTDYPCNISRPLGSLLTYARPSGGQLTYDGWIKAIRDGRTVVSRNGHNEFLSLTVNGSATPGDEIDLPGASPVQVTVQWTATEALSGPIEIVQNGQVIATQIASAGAGSPATLKAIVNFEKSGWLAARRMGADGHQVHTAAVFVIVNGAPIRASASDAQYYADWMTTLLANTSPGGVWNSFFPTSLAAAQARYRSAQKIFQEIAADAAAQNPASPTILTSQMPAEFKNELDYELGTKFYADVDGQITQVRAYTNAFEGGIHTVRIWRVSDGALVAGPYSWDIAPGTEGWRSFSLPTPLSIGAHTDYIVSISTSSDHYYAEQSQGFAAPINNGHLHTNVGSGVYTTESGAMPTSSWHNENYFRDVVFTMR